MQYKDLLEKISKKDFSVGIIGLGYVGLPLAIEFANKKIKSIGFDVDPSKVKELTAGKSYIKHIPSEKINTIITNQTFEATTDFSRLPEVDVIIICVPTPLNEHREPDIKYIEQSGQSIAKYLRKDQLVVLESSTYPGTTEEVLLPLFENLSFNSPLSKGRYEGELKGGENFKVGEDFYLAFSPEREDPNNGSFNTATIPKVVGGVTEKCLKLACKVYDHVIVKTVPVSSPKVAEAAKLLENIYRSVNIALVNELKMVFDRMDIDIWEVIEAAKTKPFGFHAFYPGPGLGGHCIPIDPFYLTWKAKEYDMNTRFIELAGEINTYMPYYVVEKTIEVLNKYKKSLNGAKILILGISYKKDIDDIRESPSLKLIEILREKAAEVDYNDPYVPKIPPTRKYKYDMSSVALTKENLSKYDLILLSTDHKYYKDNSEFIIENSELIVDSRNAFRTNGTINEKIYKT